MIAVHHDTSNEHLEEEGVGIKEVLSINVRLKLVQIHISKTHFLDI